MIERLLIAAVVVFACAAGYLLLQGYLALRRRSVLSSLSSTATAASGRFGEGATLLSFSTTECGRCRDQARAIDELGTRLGERVLRVQKVDALAEPELAERYGVLTVPTTVVLDGANRPRAVNYGFTPEAKLEAQVHAVLSD